MFGGSAALMVSMGQKDDFVMLVTSAGHVWWCRFANYSILGRNSRANSDVLRLINPTSFSNEPIGMITTGLQDDATLSRDGDSLWT